MRTTAHSACKATAPMVHADRLGVATGNRDAAAETSIGGIVLRPTPTPNLERSGIIRFAKLFLRTGSRRLCYHAVPVRSSRREEDYRNCGRNNGHPHHFPVKGLPAVVHQGVNQDRKRRKVGQQGDKPSP